MNIEPPARTACRIAFARARAVTLVLAFGAIGGLLGLGALVDRQWTGPLGDRSVAVLAILRTTDAPGAYTKVAEIDGRGASVAFAARLAADRWAVLSEPISRQGETVSIMPGRVVDPKGRECVVVMLHRPDRVDVSECLAPIARRQ